MPQPRLLWNELPKIFLWFIWQETVESALRNLLATLQKEEEVDEGIKLLTSKVLLEGKPKNIVEVTCTISCKIEV